MLLEQRTDDLEQYSCADVLITGLQTKHCSYARATGGDQQGEGSPPEELHTLEQHMVQFIKSKSIHMETQQIAACHVPPHKDKKIKPTIVAQFTNRKHKVAVLRQSKNL